MIRDSWATHDRDPRNRALHESRVTNHKSRLPYAVAAIFSAFSEVYTQQTAPLIDYYSKKNIMKTVMGVGSINDIFNKVTAVLG